MYIAYGETCFSQRNVYKWTKYMFATMSSSRKDNSWKLKHTDSLIKKKSERIGQ